MVSPDSPTSEPVARGEVDSALHLRDVIERVSDAFVALDRNWRYTYVNAHAAALFGRRPEDLIGRHIWTEFPEGVGQPFHLAYERAMAEQVVLQVESYYEPWDRWFENRIHPSPDGLSIFFHEITDRKRAEQVARESTDLLRGQNEVLQLIAEGQPRERTLDALLRVIEANGPGLLSSIVLLDADGVHVRHAAAPSLPEGFLRALDGEAIGPQAGSCGTAAFRRAPVVVEDIATDPLWASYRELALAHGLRACWSTPIFDARRRVLGTFALYFRSPGRPTERHWRLIEMATHTAAIALVKHQETQALRESEERLRLAVTGGNVGIWHWDVATNRLTWSDHLKVMVGWPGEADEPSRKMFVELIHPDDRVRIENAMQEAIAARADYDVEFRIRRPDGALRWIAAKGRGEYDTAGQPARMTGVALDITDRKRAEEEITRRQAQLAEAQRIAHLGSYEWDVATDTVYRSEELCRIFGVRLDEFAPSFAGYLDRVHPDDRGATREIIEAAFRATRPFAFEERIVRPDGTVRQLQSQGQWILDTSGRPAKLVGICQDITERKAAEEQLRASEERSGFVARATNDAIWDWDVGTGRVWWNQAVTTLFKYPADDVGTDVQWRWQRIHPEDRERVRESLGAVMERGEQFWSGEYRFRCADGAYADVFDRAFVIHDGGHAPVRVIGAMADISERMRLLETLEERVATRTAELATKNRELEHEVAQRTRVEALLWRRNEELKAFAYTVSHDLKAPLRGIAGYAQELTRRHRDGLGDRALWCIDQIVSATQNLDRLIEELLQYARLDAEEPTRTPVNVARLVESVVQERAALPQAERVEVTVDVAPVAVRTWERGLRQVVTNVVDNAFKYSRDAAAPRVTVTSETLPHTFRLVIADNGVGFDMKYHDRIFGLFSRLVRQEVFEGTGAGLAIAKKVVEKLGGSIRAEAAPGAGATFFVELPMRDGTAVTG